MNTFFVIVTFDTKVVFSLNATGIAGIATARDRLSRFRPVAALSLGDPHHSGILSRQGWHPAACRAALVPGVATGTGDSLEVAFLVAPLLTFVAPDAMRKPRLVG